MRTAAWLVAYGLAAGCGSVSPSPITPDAAAPPGDAAATDALGPPPVPVTPVAPTVEHPMYQGSQTLFKTQLGTTCTGRVAASMGNVGFCYLAASDDVKCAGRVGGIDYGMTHASIGQTSATQIMIMFQDNGMCVVKTDHTVLCMGTNTNAFGMTGTSASFQR